MSPVTAPRTVELVRLILTLFVLIAASCGVRAQPLVTPDEMKSGALLLKSGREGYYVEAPKLATDYDVTVSGPTARTRVTQRFTNPTEGFVEGVYVFPLPDESAVDTLKLIVGARVIVGEIKEKQEAKAIYEEAKAHGRKASLLEQERPNLFTNSVANIGPGETVVVQIEYQETIRQSGGEFSLRLPLVVAPRYTPEPVIQSVDYGANGYGTVNDPVPDRERISPPVLDPREHAPVNPVTIAVRLAAGFPLGEVKSHHHRVAIKPVSEDTQVVTLAEGPVPADRDFELTWTPKPGKTPSVGLFREHKGDADYLLAFVTPPALDASEDKRPREIVFVIDNSGSMGGTSMDQAKQSLLYGLSRLTPQDRFNVIRFDDTLDVLFSDTVPADHEWIETAKKFVSKLDASGGTEMVPALRAALADPRPQDGSFLRQIVFLTDGAIGNEQELFDLLGAKRGRSRVFMVGIGSAPNDYLMTRAAELGRGSFTHIGAPEQVETRMRELFAKLESPVVTELAADLGTRDADVSPDALPDLYRGEPVLLIARTEKQPAAVTLTGKIGQTPWSVTLDPAPAAQGTGLDRLWARRKIGSAEVAASLGEISRQEADKRILKLALDHGLVSALTSLVAVDKTPSRPEGERLTRADLPLNLPAGWDYDKVFGESPKPAPVLRKADAGLKLIAMSATPIATPAADAVILPQTATPSELLMLVGLILLALSLLVMLMAMRTES